MNCEHGSVGLNQIVKTIIEKSSRILFITYVNYTYDKNVRAYIRIH